MNDCGYIDLAASVFRNERMIRFFFVISLIHKTFTHAYLQKGLRMIPCGTCNLKTFGIDN